MSSDKFVLTQLIRNDILKNGMSEKIINIIF
jgi:hypothetical protein